MEKQWVLPEPLTPEDKQQVESLAGELKCPEIIAELLYRKNLKTVDQVTDFFHPQLSQQHDPFLFPDMEKAVQRILAAISGGKRSPSMAIMTWTAPQPPLCSIWD